MERSSAPCRAQRRQQTDNSIVAPELTLRGISYARRRKAKNMSANGVRTATNAFERLVLTISRYLNTDARNRSTSTTRSPLTAATCHSDTIAAWLRIVTVGVTADCEIPGQAGPLTKRPGWAGRKLSHITTTGGLARTIPGGDCQGGESRSVATNGYSMRKDPPICT